MNILEQYNQLHLSTFTPPEEKVNSASETKISEKINKKKVVCSVAAAVGIAAIVAGGIYFAAKKGKLQKPVGTPQNVGNTKPSVSQKVKQFLNKEGIVEDVTLQKGCAIKKDGSMFSGVMKTINGEGQEVAIEYNEGFITQSSINGEVFKKFENIGGLTRNQGVQITQFDKGIKKSQTLITNYDNGKTKRIYKTPDIGNNRSLKTAVEFTKDGKIAAKAQYHNSGVLEQAQIFDENGKIIREIGQEDALEKLKDGVHPTSGYVERIYDENGILRIRRATRDNYYQKGTDPRTLMLSEHKLYEPNSIKYYAADGNVEKNVWVEWGKKRQNIITGGNIYDLRLQEKIGDITNDYYLQLQFEDVNGTFYPGKGFKFNRRACSPSELRELKPQIQRGVDNLEEAYSIIQKEGIPYKTGKEADLDLVHIDIPDVIKQLREFINNIA